VQIGIPLLQSASHPKSQSEDRNPSYQIHGSAYQGRHTGLLIQPSELLLLLTFQRTLSPVIRTHGPGKYASGTSSLTSDIALKQCCYLRSLHRAASGTHDGSDGADEPHSRRQRDEEHCHEDDRRRQADYLLHARLAAARTSQSMRCWRQV